VDSSVVLSIYTGEPAGAEWLQILIGLRKRSALLVCEVVVAETRPALPSLAEHKKQLEKLGLVYSPLGFEAACRAGEIHRAYRKAGGDRKRIMADFMIGAHACIQADQLATDDEGFMRKYFSSLKLVGR
jgi:predicted nucleic acid-binding protein